jgi:translation initiation factor IF-1
MSETTTTTVEISPEIAALFDKDSYTPYQMAGAVNKALVAANIEKVLPPQMFYQYCAKGYIAASKVVVTMKKGKTETREGWVVAKADAIEWTTKYLAKNS